MALTPLELLILKFLFQNPGVGDNSRLLLWLEEVLGRSFNEKALRVAIQRLRNKLFLLAGSRLVRTRVNKGYFIRA
ncbi:MAG: hypothetical protein Fur003_2470 [Candidatus Dojkabacteria bacterium]